MFAWARGAIGLRVCRCRGLRRIGRCGVSCSRRLHLQVAEHAFHTLMLAVLGGLADVERDLIRTRTAEGRSHATAQGKHMGRPPSLTPEQQEEAIRRRAEGATLQELAHSYNVSKSTISRLRA